MIDDNTEIAAFDSPEARREMRQRHASIAKAMMALAAVGLRELEAKAASGQLHLSAEDSRKLYIAGLKLDRLARRMKNAEPVPVTPKKPN